MRHPGDRLGPQGVDREEQRRHGGAGAQRVLACGRPCRSQEVFRQQVHEGRVRRMQHEVREMIARWLHAPDHIIEPECQPSKRDVVTRQRRREHPREMRSSQATIVLIFKKVNRVVPIYELVAKPHRENGDNSEND